MLNEDKMDEYLKYPWLEVESYVTEEFKKYITNRFKK